jgi:hypothetical protein
MIDLQPERSGHDWQCSASSFLIFFPVYAGRSELSIRLSNPFKLKIAPAVSDLF